MSSSVSFSLCVCSVATHGHFRLVEEKIKKVSIIVILYLLSTRRAVLPNGAQKQLQLHRDSCSWNEAVSKWDLNYARNLLEASTIPLAPRVYRMVQIVWGWINFCYTI